LQRFGCTQINPITGQKPGLFHIALLTAIDPLNPLPLACKFDLFERAGPSTRGEPITGWYLFHTWEAN
jgi:hypothetical protein